MKILKFITIMTCALLPSVSFADEAALLAQIKKLKAENTQLKAQLNHSSTKVNETKSDILTAKDILPSSPNNANWKSGFYIGLNGGYANGSTANDLSWEPEAYPTLPGVTAGSCAAIKYFEGTSSCSAGSQFGFGGAQFGHNYFSNNVLLGIEADLDLANYKAHNLLYNDFVTGDENFTEQTIDALGTVRLRLGYEAGRFLPYVTGGLAVTHGSITQQDANCCDPPYISNKTSSNWGLGWAAGVGLEYAIDPNWSAKIEFLHVSTTSSSDVMYYPTENETFYTKAKFDADTVRFGINYYFN